MYTKFKNKNPLQKHKIKIKNMGNNNLQFYKRVLMSETTQCERHSTQWKKPFAAFASLFWGNHTVREKLALKKLLHIRKKKKKSSYSKNSQDGLSKALKNVVERFLIKWTKSAHMTVTYGQGKVTSQNDWKLLLQHSSVCIYAQLACINKIYAQLFRAKVP